MLPEGQPSIDLCVTTVRWTPDRHDISFRETPGPFSFIHLTHFLMSFSPAACASAWIASSLQSLPARREKVSSQVQCATWPRPNGRLSGTHRHTEAHIQSWKVNLIPWAFKETPQHRWWLIGFHFLPPSSSVCRTAGRWMCGSQQPEGGHKLSDAQLKRGGETNKWRECRKEVKQRKCSVTNSLKKEPMKTVQN